MSRVSITSTKLYWVEQAYLLGVLDLGDLCIPRQKMLGLLGGRILWTTIHRAYFCGDDYLRERYVEHAVDTALFVGPKADHMATLGVVVCLAFTHHDWFDLKEGS